MQRTSSYSNLTEDKQKVRKTRLHLTHSENIDPQSLGERQKNPVTGKKTPCEAVLQQRGNKTELCAG